MGGDVAAGKNIFKMLRELRINRHHIFKVSVRRAVLDHQDLAVALDDLRLDLADLFVHQNFVGQLAVENLLADLGDAPGTQRVSRARPAERRLGLFIGLEQRLVGPFRRWRRILLDAIETIKHQPRALGGDSNCLFHILYWFMHSLSLSGAGMTRLVMALPWIPGLT